MPISELTDRRAILAAMQEYDALGGDAFLSKYGYSSARRFRIFHDGKTYDSKAIVGVAFRHQYPHRGVLQSSEFSGGEATVVRLLSNLGFEVQDLDASLNRMDGSVLTANDIALFRQSRTKSKYRDLTSNEIDAYGRIHTAIERLGTIVLDNLRGGTFALKLTSGFNPRSGVRGSLPKDLWFAVYNEGNEEFSLLPQLFLIVSTRGIEYGFAAAIHPSDFSSRVIQQQFRAAAPRIFSTLPDPGSPEAAALQEALTKGRRWFLRRKTRLDPNIADFASLDDWLKFLKSEEGAEWAAGAISRYIDFGELEDPHFDLHEHMREMAEVFSTLMSTVTPQPPVENAIQKGLESFLATFSEARANLPFGQHDQIKSILNQLRTSIEALPVTQSHPHVRVSWSVGQGNWARIPWIALMDERETTSTQRGIYVAFLFPEDMSGVYLTLNQGVTDTIDELGRTAGRKILREKAQTIRDRFDVDLNSYTSTNSIKLNTEGALGLDYEASTIAHRFYPKGAMPEDKVLAADLDGLLSAYEKIMNERSDFSSASEQWWIFQANPKLFDVDSAIRELPELTWTVKHDAIKATIGDRVFIWRAGREAGVIGLGTITEAAIPRESAPEEITYHVDRERFAGSQSRVKLRIDTILEEPLLRTTIAADPRLKDLMILRFANYGTFKLSGNHATALLDAIQDSKEPRAETGAEVSPRVWIYAPGENAEYWDEFYESGVMAIGWDDLGDLSQYGSLDDITAALQNQRESEARPTNNARACYDFANTVRVGDRIFAKRGRNTIVGYGVVTGEYEHQPARPYFRNIRRVRWEIRDTWTSPFPLAIKTLTDVTDTDLVSALDRMIAGIQREPATLAPPGDPYPIERALDGLFIEDELFLRTLAAWTRRKNLILQGPPGVGKSFAARRLAYALMGFRDPSRVRTIQFHQSYSYEDFVQGYRPSGSGLTLQDGVFKDFCDRARKDADQTYVFIIDEINRGNLSKILGELMLLIEPDKRSSDWAIKLAYAIKPEERFYVPPNVYILGLMNTADRSLSLVDYALRRRFSFVALKPGFDSDKFKNELIRKGVPRNILELIVSRMSALNEEIEGDSANLGKGFCIGHSFFVPGSEGEQLDLQWYRRVMETEIIPLLDEYWFDNPTKRDEWESQLLEGSES